MSEKHVPVLLDEVIKFLNLQENTNVVDCNLGYGGHAAKLLEGIAPQGKLLGIDLDPLAIQAVQKKFSQRKDFVGRYTLVHGNFADLNNIVNKQGVFPVQGILFDLGLSSAQLDDQERGFSFKTEGHLDMRFDGESGGVDASKILQTWPERKLADIFYYYGELRKARQIAKKIVEMRKIQKFDRPSMLVEVVSQVCYHVPFNSALLARRKNPVPQVFQAIRIAVNSELENLELALPQALELLQSGGRIAVISFHSLEDRIVKNFFKRESRDCVCPREIPLCVCGHKKTIQLITKKPITPGRKEVTENSRAKSAKLRVVEKI